MAEQLKQPNLQPPPKSKLQSMQIMAYHVEHGPTAMYEVDARAAVAKFPNEWSLEPWPQSEKAEAVALVTIPDNWRDLSFPQRRALAMRLGAPNTVKIEDAEKLIAAEMDRRIADAKQAEAERPRRTPSMRDRD